MGAGKKGGVRYGVDGMLEPLEAHMYSEQHSTHMSLYFSYTALIGFAFAPGAPGISSNESSVLGHEPT